MNANKAEQVYKVLCGVAPIHYNVLLVSRVPGGLVCSGPEEHNRLSKKTDENLPQTQTSYACALTSGRLYQESALEN